MNAGTYHLSFRVFWFVAIFSNALIGSSEDLRVDGRFVRIPSGEFKMGDDKGLRNEKPVRSVYVAEYEIAKFPVTYGLWTMDYGRRFIGGR